MKLMCFKEKQVHIDGRWCSFRCDYLECPMGQAHICTLTKEALHTHLGKPLRGAECMEWAKEVKE